MRYQRSMAERRTVDGIVFDSIREAEQYLFFKALMAQGSISNLRMGTKFNFELNGVHIGSYRADFVYQDHNNVTHVIDVKGWKKSPKTGKLLPRIDRDFRLRANLMKACFGLEVEVI